MAKSTLDGKTYAPLRVRKVKDRETGELRHVEIPKRIKPWWFTADNDKICLNLKYSAKILELAKGKSAVEIDSMAELIPTFETLKAAVDAGCTDHYC